MVTTPRVSGVGIDTLVGSLKACKITGICEDWDIKDAILYAITERYHVINMSFGGPDPSEMIQEAVVAAHEAGLVLVSSAGNEYLHQVKSYPAAYEGVIAVAATDHYDNLASFSNFGQWVEVAAPGVNILSTYPSAGCFGEPDCYNWMSGTSMASPIVSGAAALVFANIGGDDPILSPTLRYAVIDAILNNADHIGALGQNMLAWTQYGRLNLQAALLGTPSAFCGDVACNGNENQCTCPSDCGDPPLTEISCSDGMDNDCDGDFDCDDEDCNDNSACIINCLPIGSKCSSNNECCSLDCRGKCR